VPIVCVPGTVSSPGDTDVNKPDSNVCPFGAYIPVKEKDKKQTSKTCRMA
jgi:hypothetical protein